MVIYRILNLSNDLFYIGQTIRNPDKRWREHCNNARKFNNPLYNAMNFYGIENFKFEVLEEIENIEMLNKREEELILNNIYPNGYNLKQGGNNKRYSQFSKDKISNGNLGKTKTRTVEDREIFRGNIKKRYENLEYRQKHKEAVLKANNTESYKAKKSIESIEKWKSQEFRDKINLKIKGVLKTPEHNEKLKEGMLKSHAKTFQVTKIKKDKTVEIVGSWDNQATCAIDLNILQPKISQVLHCKRKTHRGYIFKYIQ